MGSATVRNIYIDTYKKNKIKLEEENEYIFNSIKNIFSNVNIAGVINFDYDQIKEKKIDEDLKFNTDFISCFTYKNMTNFLLIEIKDYRKAVFKNKAVDLLENIIKFLKFCEKYKNIKTNIYFIFYDTESMWVYEYDENNKYHINEISIEKIIKILENKDDIFFLNNNQILEKYLEYTDFWYLVNGKKVFKATKIEQCINNIRNSSKKSFIINGGPGTGKTALAHIFYQSEKDKTAILCLNKLLVNIYKEKYYSEEDMIFYNLNDLESIDLTKIKYLIVDEAQRITQETIDHILNIYKNNSFKIIFLGDDKQKIYKYDSGIEKIKSIFNSCENLSEIVLTNYFRITEDDDKLIQFILNYHNNLPSCKNCSLKINFYSCKNSFLKDKFSSNNSYFGIPSKMHEVLNYDWNFDKAFYNDALSNETIINSKEFYDEFHLISREFEKGFIVLPKEINKKNFSKFKNSIYVLMTRATKELNLYIYDKDLQKEMI